MKTFKIALLCGLFSHAALADCPSSADAGKTIFLDIDGAPSLTESRSTEAGVIETIIYKHSDERWLVYLYAHPVLFPETFLHKISGKAGVLSNREYSRSLAPLDDLERVKTWEADFVIRNGNEEPQTGRVRAEFQKVRYERIGDCRYKVWEVLVHEQIDGSDQTWRKVLYSQDLKRVLRSGTSDKSTGIIYGRGFGKLWVKEQ